MTVQSRTGKPHAIAAWRTPLVILICGALIGAIGFGPRAALGLFLTPMSFLISTTRNARDMIDRLALALGLVLGPVLTYWQVGLDLMWTGIVGGSVAYIVHRVRRAAT